MEIETRAVGRFFRSCGNLAVIQFFRQEKLAIDELFLELLGGQVSLDHVTAGSEGSAELRGV
jgi:hypothetical protein